MLPTMPTLIFDLDGTLIDSAPAILAAFASALRDAGIRPRVALSAALIGPPLRDTLALLTGCTDPTLIERCANDFKTHYDTVGYKATVAYPGIAAMLCEFRARHVALHLATNKREVPTRLIVEHLGWSGLFDSIHTLDQHQPPLAGKACLLRELIFKHGLRPADTVYIGDRHEDFDAARSCELGFVGARWGYGGFGAEAAWPVANAPSDLIHHVDIG